MRPLRRLGATAPDDPYRRALRGSLRSFTLTEAEFDALPDGRRIVDVGAVLAVDERHGRFDLHYSYRDHGDFRQRFPEMLARLLPACDPVEAPLGLRLRLTDRPSRPYVEPVLHAQAFRLDREWIEMVLHQLPDASASEELMPGYTIRPVRKDDIESIVQLEELAFPNPMLTVDLASDALRTAPIYCLIETGDSEAVAGSLLAEVREGATGHVSTVAIHPEHQCRGLGEAAMRWALATFRERGARRASLTVSTENAPAIALYRKLGFIEDQFGFDYARPLDEAEVQRILGIGTGHHVRVRRNF